MARLAARVPALGNALGRLSGRGICVNALLPRIGKTVDVAVLPAKGRLGEGVVVMTKPSDVATLKRLIPVSCCYLTAAGCGMKRIDRIPKGAKAKAHPKPPALLTRELKGWLLVSNSKTVLDRFRSEARKGTLASSRAFRSAFGSLAKDALVRVYMRGDESLRLAASRLSGGLLAPASAPTTKKGPLDWIALSLKPGAGGLRLDGTVAGIVAKNAPNPLPTQAPAGSLVAATLNGTSLGLGKAFGELVKKDSKLLVQLGLGLRDLVTLSAGKLTFSLVDSASTSERCEPSPVSLLPLLERSGFALELQAPGAVATGRKLERLLPLAAAQLNGHIRRVTAAGSPAEELTIGAVRLYLGTAAGKIFIASAPSIVWPSAKLSAAAAFLRAERTLSVPAENAGVLYVNLERVGETAAASPIPAKKGQKRASCSEATTNPLGGISSLLAYLSASGDRLLIKGIITVG